MALRDVIEEVRQEIAAAGSGINEADAKAALITPILSELGWRGLQRIRSEYAVDQGRMRLDYALIGSGTKPVALIEAKAPREDLDGHVAQVLNYAFHEGVDICVLTTGVIWWLYLPREKGNPAERRFAALDLQSDEVMGVAEILESCLQYEALTSGAGEKRAKELLDALQLVQRMRSEIPRAWQRLIEGPNEMLIELVQEEVYDTLGARPSQEQVKRELHAIVSGTAPVSVAEAPSNARPVPLPAEPVRTNVRPARRSKSSSTRVLEFRMWGKTYLVRHQYEVLTNVVELVYARHRDSFSRALQITNFHDDPERCVTPYQIGASRYYVNRSLNFGNMKQTCERLLEAFGYSADDLEIVTED